MELREALTQIAEIRQQMARGQLFRGYRAATTAFSGAAAGVTALVQAFLVPDAAAHPKLYVLLWAASAAVCLILVGIEMVVRTRKSASLVQRQLTLLAVEQFVPSVVAGALLTYVFTEYLPSLVWVLPSLWMMFFSLGIFASARLLPRMVFGVAGFYLLAGMFVLLLTRGEDSPWRFSPWLMGGTFGLGQMMIAAILYWKLERSHE